jgi:centrosomal protein CEP120
MSFCTVLVTVLQGRGFGKSRGKLYVSCNFNKEILATDPTLPTQTPVWDTEFSWTLTPKTLSFLRSQRSKLKIVCYSLLEDQREVIGYVMLDLRATEVLAFFPLLNTKSVDRPEIKLHFRVTNQREILLRNKQIKSQTTFMDVEQILRSNIQPEHTLDADIKLKLKASDPPTKGKSHFGLTDLPFEVVLDDKGWYQLGPSESTDCFYTLWISIAFAEHILQLYPSDDKEGYYFYYSFLGNDILTQKFPKLSQCNFESERVSIRFKSHGETLNTLLKQIGKIVVHLCHDLEVIGYAHVGLDLKVGSEMSIMEKVYPLSTPSFVANNDDELPGIGISVALSLDDKPIVHNDHTKIEKVAAILHESNVIAHTVSQTQV